VRLLAEGGPFDGRFFEIPLGESMVGRALENDLAFDDPSLSRRHSRLHLDGAGRIEVEDLGSSNGTYVNGRKIGRAVAAAGDVLRFGELQFRIIGAGAGSVGTRAVIGIPRSQLYALLGGGAATMAALMVMIVVLVRKPGPVRASAAESIAKITATADEHLRSARGLFQDHKYTDANSEIERALELDPANAEARRLRGLIVRAPDDERLYKSASAALSTGVRKGIETALRLRDEISTGSTQYAQLTTKLVTQLETFGVGRCTDRGWADCAWALCKEVEIAPADARPSAGAITALREAETHVPRMRCMALK
jgi:hypothetical protein